MLNTQLQNILFVFIFLGVELLLHADDFSLMLFLQNCHFFLNYLNLLQQLGFFSLWLLSELRGLRRVKIVRQFNLPYQLLGLVIMLILPECAFNVWKDLTYQYHYISWFLSWHIYFILELFLCLIQQLQQLKVFGLQSSHSVSVRLRSLRCAKILILLRDVLLRLLLV